MKTYIGTKIINAQPMTRAEYNEFRGWTLPVDENGADAGYLVEYTDGGKPNTLHFAGYVSWSPAEQFEGAYLEIDDVSGLPPHQQRVVAEKAELDDKRTKLAAFYSTSIFRGLPESEQSRLLRQGVAMRTYSEILGERIGGFKSDALSNDDAIEAEIQAKGLTAPRVTPADIEANIASEHYFTAADGATQAACTQAMLDAAVKGHGVFDPDSIHKSLDLLTFCVLVLRNGFTVTGESAVASPENFDADVGRKVARANAINKVWPLMGYALKERLYQATKPAQSPV